MDITKYVWDDDPWWHAEPLVVKRIYREKWRVADFTRPDSAPEIGVRAGYTAAVFLDAGCERYIGLDASVPLWGGTDGAVAYAKGMLPREFPDAQVEIHDVDTQAVHSLAQRHRPRACGRRS